MAERSHTRRSQVLAESCLFVDFYLCHNSQFSIVNSQLVYRLGGNSCLSGDWMGYWQFDHELQVGEQIIFEDMIHYTTVKTNTFNGITHPSIAMEHSDGTLEMLREYSYEDYRDRMD